MFAAVRTGHTAWSRTSVPFTLSDWLTLKRLYTMWPEGEVSTAAGSPTAAHAALRGYWEAAQRLNTSRTTRPLEGRTAPPSVPFRLYIALSGELMPLLAEVLDGREGFTG
jgi:hypothetical protein